MVEWGREGLDGRPRPVSCAHLLGNALTPHHRATIKALPHPPNRPRPYGSAGLLSSFQASVDVYYRQFIGLSCAPSNIQVKTSLSAYWLSDYVVLPRQCY